MRTLALIVAALMASGCSNAVETDPALQVLDVLDDDADTLVAQPDAVSPDATDEDAADMAAEDAPDFVDAQALDANDAAVDAEVEDIVLPDATDPPDAGVVVTGSLIRIGPPGAASVVCSGTVCVRGGLQ
jgi:hypothetical protein